MHANSNFYYWKIPKNWERKQIFVAWVKWIVHSYIYFVAGMLFYWGTLTSLFNVKLAHVFWLYFLLGCGSLTFTPHLFLMDIVNFQTCSSRCYFVSDKRWREDKRTLYKKEEMVLFKKWKKNDLFCRSYFGCL